MSTKQLMSLYGYGVAGSAGGAGSLSVAITQTWGSGPPTDNLTTFGTVDWAEWHTGSATPNQRKSTGAGIFTLGVVGGGSWTNFGGFGSTTVSWTDGTPTASGSIKDSQITGSGVGTGFTVTVPANTTARKMRINAGGFECATFKVTATLSDASAGPSVTSPTSINTGGDNDFYVVVDYAAASSGQSLTVKIELLTTGGGFPVVYLQSAAVQ